MSGKSEKKYYYVLVFTNSGPKYVTSLGEHKTCYWNEKEKPLSMSKCYAENVCFGLCMNSYSSCVAQLPYELESQPYNYKDYEIKFEERKKENETHDNLHDE